MTRGTGRAEDGKVQFTRKHKSTSHNISCVTLMPAGPNMSEWFLKYCISCGGYVKMNEK